MSRSSQEGVVTAHLVGVVIVVVTGCTTINKTTKLLLRRPRRAAGHGVWRVVHSCGRRGADAVRSSQSSSSCHAASGCYAHSCGYVTTTAVRLLLRVAVARIVVIVGRGVVWRGGAVDVTAAVGIISVVSRRVVGVVSRGLAVAAVRILLLGTTVATSWGVVPCVAYGCWTHGGCSHAVGCWRGRLPVGRGQRHLVISLAVLLAVTVAVSEIAVVSSWNTIGTLLTPWWRSSPRSCCRDSSRRAGHDRSPGSSPGSLLLRLLQLIQLHRLLLHHNLLGSSAFPLRHSGERIAHRLSLLVDLKHSILRFGCFGAGAIRRFRVRRRRPATEAVVHRFGSFVPLIGWNEGRIEVLMLLMTGRIAAPAAISTASQAPETFATAGQTAAETATDAPAY